MSNFLRKITSAVSVATIAVSSVSSTLTVSAASEFLAYADALAEAGVINSQTSEAGYRLGDRITRAEVAKLAVNLAGEEVAPCAGDVYSDVSASLGDLCGFVEAAANAGIVSLAVANFRPMDNVTRAEVVKMLLKASGVEASASAAGYVDVTSSLGDLQGYINAAAELGLVSSTALYFRPNDTATRGEVFKIASNLVGGEDDEDIDDIFGPGDEDDTTTTPGGSTGSTTTTGSTTVVGNLTVGLNPASAPSQNIPQAGVVTYGKFDLVAGTSDVRVDGIKVTRGGLGNRSDISRVFFEKNGVRISSRQSVSSDDTVNITFSPALVVKAGSTETVDLVVSMSGSTNSQHNFMIKSAADVMSSATVGGTFPLSTATMTTASYQVVNAIVYTGGTTSTYRVGDKNVELGQFRIENRSSDDKNAIFKSIQFRVDESGNLMENVGNLSLYRNGAKVSTAVTADGNYVTFTLNDSIGFGRTETYYIQGDINAVDNTAGDNYTFVIRNPEDLTVAEQVSGFRANVTFNGTSASQLSLSKYNVSGGDVILSKATTVVSSQTVAPGAVDVTLLAADLKVAQSITFEDMTVSLTNIASGSTVGDLARVFTNIKLMVGNSVVSTFTPSAGSSATSFTFDSTFTVSANTPVKILGTVRSTTGITGSFKIAPVSLASAFSRVEYANNGNTVQPSQLIGSADGISTVVGTSTLTFTRNDGIANQLLAAGSKNVTALQFTMKANDVSDVTVTKLKFATGANTVFVGGSSLSNIPEVALYVDGVLLKTRSLSSGNADFNDVQIPVKRNAQVTVKLVATYDNALASGSVVELKLIEQEARDTNGITLPNPAGFINAAVTGPKYSFVNAGSVTLQSNSATPNAALLTPSVQEVEVARYTLGTKNDGAKLTDLYLTNNGTADLSSRIRSSALYDLAGNKLADGTVLGTGVIQFSLGDSSTFIVPKNSSASYVLVKASFNDITSADQDGGTVTLAIGTGSVTNPVIGTKKGVRFISEASGNLVDDVTGSAVSKTHMLARSKPVIAVSASATSATHTFTVTADANNRIFLSGVTLSVQNPANGPMSYILYKDQETSGNELAAGSGTFVSGTLPISFSGGTGAIVGGDFAGTLEISAGTTKTFILQVNGAGTVAANSRRTIRVTDAVYLDSLDTGGTGSFLVPSISPYTNVGVPTAESVYVY